MSGMCLVLGNGTAIALRNIMRRITGDVHPGYEMPDLPRWYQKVSCEAGFDWMRDSGSTALAEAQSGVTGRLLCPKLYSRMECASEDRGSSTSRGNNTMGRAKETWSVDMMQQAGCRDQSRRTAVPRDPHARGSNSTPSFTPP